MLLLVVILWLGLIGMSIPAQNPGLYDVIVCVSKDSNSTTKVAWHTPEGLHNATCEIGGYQKVTNPGTSATSLILVNLPSNGYKVVEVEVAVMYVVQVTCLLKTIGNNDEKQYKSEEIEFLPDHLTHEKPKCTQVSHQPTEDSNGVYLCAWQAESSKTYPSTLLWWWPTQPNITSCDLSYQQVDSNKNRTKTLNNLSVNGSVHLVASEARVTCMDDLHRIHRSQRVKLKQGYSSAECKLSVVWHNTGSPTVLPTNSPPVRFHGFNVSSIGKGLVLAFAVVFIAIGFSVFFYRRYKWFLHRRAQRLLRVEDPEENSLEEFQRMV